jgi:hypothetical protein
VSVIKRIRNYISGEDLSEPDKRDSSFNGSDPASNPTNAPSPDHALFKRLYDESSHHSYVRRVKTETLLAGTRLTDEIIMLMFNLQNPSGTYVQSSLLEALDQRQLSNPLSVVYIYLDAETPFHSAYELQDRFYDRIMALSKKSTSLLRFIDERYQLYLDAPRNQRTDRFDPDNEDRASEFRGMLVNLFACHFSVCRKDFPRESTDYIFIVGRMPMYDSQEMDRYRLRQRQGVRQNNQSARDIYLAVTVKADGHHEGKPIRFNAHRFGDSSDNSPQREFSLYIGNWRTDWEFSIGSAEHDEIQHTDMLDRAERLRLNNLQITNNHWDYVPMNPNLPNWIKFFNRDVTRTPKEEGIRLCCVKPPVLNHPLVNVISRQQFRQEISLIGRMLPNSGGQLQRFRDVTDRLLRAAVRNLTVTSAIEVRSSLWLIVIDDNKVMRVSQTDQRNWEAAALDHGATFSVGDTEYRWHARRTNLYPDRFAGTLSIYPAAPEASSFKKQLNVDQDAEGFLVSFDGQFERTINPDDLLGRNGVVSIKCVEVTDEGRGKYAFLPVQNPIPRNPFFAFQPVYARERGWPTGKSWLTYDDESPSDLTVDTRTGEVLYDGKSVRAEDHTYHLISGSSLFQLKVSGTPYIGTPVVTAPTPRLPTATPEAAPPVATASSDFQPIQIQIQLLKTRWAGYGVKDADRSNFAAHFHLTPPRKTQPTHFLKAFFPHSTESANRELRFYDRYRRRASQLFLRPPEILTTTSEASNEETPWALVFPLLYTYEKYLSSAGQATIAQAAAVGVGMATLFKAMAEDGLINFDIDVTQFCFDRKGQLVIIDFDNVFQILTDPEDETQLEPLLGILREGRLPAKNSFLPPEANAFIDTANPDDRPKQLSEIGPAFSTYMLAVVVLQLLKAEFPLKPGTLVHQGVAENLNSKDVKLFEDLLAQMLSTSAGDRPEPAEVLTRLEAIVKAICEQNETARADCLRLLGRQHL